MPESDQRENPAGPTTATMEPPAPPAAPPTTGVAGAPRPKRRRWIAWLVGVLVVLAVVAALTAVVVLVSRGHNTGPTAAESASAFDSAMKKAGVKAAAPAQPVALTSVKPTGSHAFEADFTGPELAALVNTFQYTATVAGQKLSVSSATVEIPGNGTVTLSGTITLGDGSYSGSVTGPVAYENGRITSTGATAGSAEGITLSGSQLNQATDALVRYLNDYLAAAPGLKVESAQLAGTNVHVKGTAPDSITTQ